MGFLYVTGILYLVVGCFVALSIVEGLYHSPDDWKEVHLSVLVFCLLLTVVVWPVLYCFGDDQETR